MPTDQSELPKRKRGWAPGQSGNLKGRPKGVGEPARLRALLARHLPDVLEQLVLRARAGDVSAARVILERCMPGLKATELPITVTLPADASLADTGRALVAAAGAGEIAPGQAAALLQALGALGRIVEVEELEQRIAALEAHKAGPHD